MRRCLRSPVVLVSATREQTESELKKLTDKITEEKGRSTTKHGARGNDDETCDSQNERVPAGLEAGIHCQRAIKTKRETWTHTLADLSGTHAVLGHDDGIDPGKPQDGNRGDESVENAGAKGDDLYR